MEIKIDYREKDNRVSKAKDILTKHNITINNLISGDYIFNDKVAFEYKTVKDFIQSIKDQRAYNQAIDMAKTYPFHFIIIVGNYDEEEQEYGEYVSKEWYCSVICRLNTITTVIEVPNNDLAFKRMEKQAEKCLKAKPLLKHNNLPKSNPAMQYLVGFKQVSDTTAEKIVNECGLYYLPDLLGLTVEDLVQIQGIGEKTAKNIIKQIKE